MSDGNPPPASPDPVSRGSGKNRDEFDSKTKETLWKQVSNLCSNPLCRRQTAGPHSDPTKTTNIGVAAHITAASPGGPRYDPSLDSDARKHTSNGIWLCQVCAHFIDSDSAAYPADKLREWKGIAERHARAIMEGGLKDGWATELPKELGNIVSLSVTTAPPTSQHVALSSDGQFWLVLWDSPSARYKWDKVTADYAIELLQPILPYRNLTDWRDLFRRQGEHS